MASASVFDDLSAELEVGKKCFDHIWQKDVMESAEAVTDWMSYNLEWFSEPMPVEDKSGSAFEREVRQMICDATYREDVPEMPPGAPPQKEDILIFADQEGLCQAILDKAPDGLIGSRKVVTKPARLLGVEDFESLLSKSKPWDLILIGFTLDAPKSGSPADVIEQQSAAVKAILLMLQVCFKRDGCCRRMAVLTNDIFSEQEATHKERGLEVTTHGTMFGFCNTARLEMEFPVMLIDTELTDCQDLLPHLAAELFRPATFGVNTVRHCYPYPIKAGIRTNRPAGRYVARQMTTRQYQKANVKFVIPEEGTIAISGGNGALGLVMGLWLLDFAEREKTESRGSYNPRFKIQFLSRSAKISDQNVPNWEKLQRKAKALGIEVEQGRMDMSSQAAVDDFVSKVSPHLIGFIHSAGILQDSMIPNQSWEKFESVFSSKHWAAYYLHDALERFTNPNLKFFWMFSSQSVYGNMGQLNYSASNAALDALARHRIALGKPACAIQWGAWGEVGMAATMDDTMRRRVMMGPSPYFTVKQGLEGLENGLSTGLPGFTVFLVNPPVYFGMVQPDQGTVARYSRNFSSEWVPTPAPSTFDTEQAYNIYRMYRYLVSPYGSTDPLVWSQYTRPRLQANAGEEEEEDDGTVVLGYGLA